jgi:16S rRNA (guanine1207-N2)-methyltransferase
MSIPKIRPSPSRRGVPSGRPSEGDGHLPARRRGQAHYFDPVPAAPSKPRPVFLHLHDLDLELAADRGVFGSRGLDLGTVTLLKEAPAPPATGHLLDLGSGYGPIAITLARRSPDARVWAVDVNERALELVAVNAAALATPNVTAARPDAVPEDIRFTAIYSNPPVRVGKAALHELLTRWLGRLVAGGHAYLVVQRNLGADSLASWLVEQGHQVTRLKSKKGYRVLDVAARLA